MCTAHPCYKLEERSRESAREFDIFISDGLPPINLSLPECCGIHCILYTVYYTACITQIRRVR